MEKKNVDLVAKEHLNLISEALKKEGSASSHSIPDKTERLRIEVKVESGRILPGMLTYDTPPQVILSRIDKEGCYVLSKAEMQNLKEKIERFLQRKDEWKPLHLE